MPTAIPLHRRLVRSGVMCCVYMALIPCLCLALWGVFILTSVTGVRRWSPTWASMEAPIMFDTRSEKATAILKLSEVPSLPSIKAESGPRRILQSGDEVDITLQLILGKEDKGSEVFHAQIELLSYEGSKIQESLSAISRPPAHDYLHLFKLYTFPSQLLLHLWKRELVEVCLIDHFTERETEPLESIGIVLTARYGGQIPVIYDASIRLSKHLGLVDRWLYRLRPSDSMSLLWMMGGMSLVVIPMFLALILYKTAHWATAVSERTAVPDKTAPRTTPASETEPHIIAEGPSTPSKCNLSSSISTRHLTAVVASVEHGLRFRMRGME